MSARRQGSMTSLAQYARPGANSPSQNPTMDFCNAFWGIGDAGVDVLFARLRGAMRTVDELKNFWKERCAIEEEYSKRLAKLSKITLGRDEIGEMREALDAIRLETDRQAGFHLTLAQTIRGELEGPTAAFYSRQLDLKKNSQAGIEREFKAKQTQEGYVLKAREKYEQDCMRINSYTAQATLVQGKDLEKIRLKLERAEQTVGTNERDFANFAKAYGETVQKWERAWKDFCDRAQDIEEERLEFIKDILWAYANGISTVCVSDDESCENWRTFLEQMDLERDMENFVRDYGTGNQIPDPVVFVNYNSPDAIPSSSARTSTHPSHFKRTTRRERRHMNHAPPEDEEPVTNVAGVGAGRSQSAEPQLTRQPSRGRSDHPKTNGYVNGDAPSSSPSSSVAAGSFSPQRQVRKSLQYNRDPLTEPIDHNAETFIKVGSNAYKVDLNKVPQQSPTRPGPSPSSASSIQPGGGVDPLAQQLQELKNAVSTSGSIRRSNSRYRPGDSSVGPSRRGTLDSLAAPSGSSDARTPSPARDYRNSAEIVVGAYPSSTSRPASPNPPTAAFMVPKPSVAPGSEVIEGVLSDYHQSLPGERKSISRGSYVGTSPTAEQQRHQSGGSISRPSSQLGHVGIGAHGSRSNSPQPPSRGPSPGPGSLISVPDIGRAGSVSARATSPNSVGIALDSSGRVLHDEMAQRYQQQQTQPQQRPPSVHHQPQYQPQQRRTSYVAPGPPPPGPVPGPPPAMYGTPSPYQQPPPPPPPQTYSHVPAPGPQPSYNPPPPPQTPHYQHTQPVYQQPPSGYVNGVQRGPSVSTSYYGSISSGMNGLIQQPPPPPVTAPPPAPVQQPQVVQQPPVQSMQYQQPTQQRSNPNLHPHRTSTGYHSVSSGRRSPSPQAPLSTGQVTEEGTPILFYVQAIYDYAATIDEEFDFTAGDIIAVTATPEDGWWSGELLDENRRQRGRHVFPSNFVQLLE